MDGTRIHMDNPLIGFLRALDSKTALQMFLHSYITVSKLCKTVAFEQIYRHIKRLFVINPLLNNVQFARNRSELAQSEYGRLTEPRIIIPKSSLTSCNID